MEGFVSENVLDIQKKEVYFSKRQMYAAEKQMRRVGGREPRKRKKKGAAAGLRTGSNDAGHGADPASLIRNYVRRMKK